MLFPNGSFPSASDISSTFVLAVVNELAKLCALFANSGERLKGQDP